MSEKTSNTITKKIKQNKTTKNTKIDNNKNITQQKKILMSLRLQRNIEQIR